MATSNFKSMSKMKTTEPSVDEAGTGMKKGGKTKKMAMGGLPMAAPMARRPMAAPMARRPMAAPALLQRKKGGEMESKSDAAKEDREIKAVKKELKSHESKKASKGHPGLRAGGSAPKAGKPEVGGLLGGIEATRADKRRVTEGVEAPGYKNGGHVAMTCKSTGGFTVNKKMAKC